MTELIREKLKEIEEKENIKIIHCVESGSRAWGFASPDSDYDVRFIYVRPKEYYLRLDKTRDVIEWQLDDTLDINGWDLQKALRLLHKSNPTLFEWNSSPIIYKTTDEWKEVSSIIEKYFVEKSGLYHYLSTAKSNYREYLKGDVVPSWLVASKTRLFRVSLPRKSQKSSVAPCICTTTSVMQLMKKHRILTKWYMIS